MSTNPEFGRRSDHILYRVCVPRKKIILFLFVNNEIICENFIIFFFDIYTYSYLFENFDDSLEKNVDGLEELSADVSCEDVGIPGAYGTRVRFRVIPE